MYTYAEKKTALRSLKSVLSSNRARAWALWSILGRLKMASMPLLPPRSMPMKPLSGYFHQSQDWFLDPNTADNHVLDEAAMKEYLDPALTWGHLGRCWHEARRCRRTGSARRGAASFPPSSNSRANNPGHRSQKEGYLTSQRASLLLAIQHGRTRSLLKMSNLSVSLCTRSCETWLGVIQNVDCSYSPQ